MSYLAYTTELVTCVAYFGLVGIHYDMQRDESHKVLNDQTSDRLAAGAYSMLGLIKFMHLFPV